MAITHDEEIGRVGAMGVAEFLSKQAFGRDGQFEFVVDEGTVILEEALPTISNPIAIIGIAEKGYMGIRYQIDLPPGHSSMPSAPTAIGILARAVDKMERTPKPSQFGQGPEMDFLLGVTPYLKFPLRIVLSNLWCFGTIIQWVLTRKPSTDALMRTTTAFTLVSGGEKENTLPTSASATVNRRRNFPNVSSLCHIFHLDRLHTADTCEKILEHNRRVIDDDRIVPHVSSCYEPSPVSPYGKDVYAYRVLEQTIRQTFEKDREPIIVVPGLMLGGTDSRSYTNLTKNLYRYSPFIYRHDDLNRLHGDNERIRPGDIQRALNFYFHLIVNNQLGHLPEIQTNPEL